MRITALLFTCSLFLVACGGGGGGNTEPAITTVTVSGTITYDKVPHVGGGNGALDYDNTLPLPARGIEVLALDEMGETVRSTVTDNQGRYTLTLSPNTDIRIQASAELKDSRWSIKVTDNTQGNALYALQGSLLNTGESNSSRNLHAASGWTGNSYTETRAAGPFAILDVAYTIVSQIEDVQFPAMEFRWSPNNRAAEGELADGDITTSFYTNDGLPTIYLLGFAGDLGDTDEYDEDVVAHEFTHYLEDQISRSDSIGGAHSLSAILDIRLAFSEGLGNAVSGMVNGDQYYVDSTVSRLGNSRTSLSIDLEDNDLISQGLPVGWYTESAIQALLYDIVDDTQDANDDLNLSVNDLFSVLTAPSFTASPALASIYSFHEAFRTTRSADTNALEAMLSNFEIHGRGEWAEGETNDAFQQNILPIYTPIGLNAPTTLCSIQLFGEFNRLSNHRFMRLNINTAGNYQISATRLSGNTSSDPDILVYSQGQLVARSESGTNNQETLNTSLVVGEYVVDIADFFNLDNDTSTGGTTCFEITASQQ